MQSLQSLQGDTSGFQYFIGKFSSDLILFRIVLLSSQSFGARFDNDSVRQYTVLNDVEMKVRLLPILQLKDLVRRKTSFIMSGYIPLNTYCIFLLCTKTELSLSSSSSIEDKKSSSVTRKHLSCNQFILFLSLLLCIIDVKVL